MDAAPRRNRGAVVWVVPLILSLVVMRRAAAAVRTVDFLQIFMCGMIAGICLINMIQFFKRGSASKS
jgi:hypothetical protein